MGAVPRRSAARGARDDALNSPSQFHTYTDRGGLAILLNSDTRPPHHAHVVRLEVDLGSALLLGIWTKTMLTARIAFACRSARTTLFTFANEQFRIGRLTSRFFKFLWPKIILHNQSPPPSYEAKTRLMLRANVSASALKPPQDKPQRQTAAPTIDFSDR